MWSVEPLEDEAQQINDLGLALKSTLTKLTLATEFPGRLESHFSVSPSHTVHIPHLTVEVEPQMCLESINS